MPALAVVALLHVSSHSGTQAEGAATMWDLLLFQQRGKGKRQPHSGSYLELLLDMVHTHHVHSHHTGQASHMAAPNSARITSLMSVGRGTTSHGQKQGCMSSQITRASTCQRAQAAMTKYHSPGSLSNRTLVLHSSGD